MEEHDIKSSRHSRDGLTIMQQADFTLKCLHFMLILQCSIQSLETMCLSALVLWGSWQFDSSITITGACKHWCMSTFCEQLCDESCKKKHIPLFLIVAHIWFISNVV